MATTHNGVPRELLPEWDGEKNKVTPEKARGPVKYWWRCLNGEHEHSYERALNTKPMGRGCPYCAGKKTLKGFNDAASAHPHLLSEWSGSNERAMDEYTSRSAKPVLWKCNRGHEWTACLQTRSRGHGCPFCSGNKADPILNGIGESLRGEWDHERNSARGLRLEDVTQGSGVKAWWLGAECGHSWEASILHRGNGAGCPFCASNQVLPGFNDFATHYPQWLPLWHPDRNGEVTPSSVMKKSPGKRWWLCSKGHEWEQSPKNMAGVGPRCPECSQVFSRLEAIVMDNLESIYPGKIQPRRRILEHTPGYRGRWEIDLLLPELKLGFEVQDFATHSRDRDDEPITYRGIKGAVKAGPVKHERKRALAMEQHGIILIDIWEDEIFDGSYRDILESAIAEVTGGNVAVEVGDSLR